MITRIPDEELRRGGVAWSPGMYAIDPDDHTWFVVGIDEIYPRPRLHLACTGSGAQHWAEAVWLDLVLEHPATLGCLLGQVCERYRYEHAHAVYSTRMLEWHVVIGADGTWAGLPSATQGEALLAAIQAAPGSSQAPAG